MIAWTMGSACAIWMLSRSTSEPTSLFVWLGAVHLFNNAWISLTVGPICAASVPPSLFATATGIVIASGELGGGGLATMLAGQVADRLGIEHILVLPMGAMGVALVLTVFLKETPWSAYHGE